MIFSKNIFLYFLSLLFFANVIIFFGVFSERQDGKLLISFLNIGQGDAIFIKAPNGAEALLDAGPGHSVLSELGKVMPFYDKSIDVAIISNPDSDHIGGFLDVVKRYKVDYEIEPGTVSKSGTYQALEDSFDENKVKKIIARRGMDIILDKEKNVFIHILFPDRDVSRFSTNDGSLVAKLIYGKTSALLEGDAPKKTEDYLLSLNKSEIDSDIIKIGHHGSRTSSAEEYLKTASPKYAVISVGKDNKYGHPHKETLDVLNNLKIPILRTDELGRITFLSDGNNFELE